MGPFRSKEDDVSRISTSIFVSNFPESFSAKDLFHSCKQYGHVVDSFIPTKRKKEGKRFGFVHFINIFNVERLVNNLCTIWVGRSKLHANVARFNRDNLKNVSNNDKRDKGGNISVEMESTPSIVLDDECLNTKDFSCSLMGRVNEFSSLSNLKKVLGNEGFDALKISYLSELWVLLEFESVKGKLLEIDDYDDMNFYSKRLCIITKVSQNILKSFKIVFRGKVYWLRAKEVPGWTPEFSEDEDEEDVSVEDNLGGIHSDKEINNGNEESDVEEVLETVFGDTEEQKENPSEDPFGIYPLLNKDKNVREHETNEEESSLKHPLGFTLDFNEGQADGGGAKLVNEKVAEDVNSFVHTVGDKANSGSVNNMSGSMGSCHLKKSGRPRSGCSILSVMEEIIKVGHTMGYNMDGCVKDITKIIKSQGEVRVNR
ncbi:nucleotide-binding alpha-beta plait domain-containing protein [Tanacetum coccineum]